MNHSKIFCLILPTVLPGVIDAQDLEPFKVSSYRWPGAVDYYHSAGCSSEFREAFDQATEVISKLSVPINYAGVSSHSGYDDRNVVICSDDREDLFVLDLQSGSPAVEHVADIGEGDAVFGTVRYWTDPETDELLETDIWFSTIEVNTNNTWTAIYHELGHFVGEVHNDESDSIMNPNPTESDLSIRDIARISSNYKRCHQSFMDESVNVFTPRIPYLSNYFYAFFRFLGGNDFRVTEIGVSYCEAPVMNKELSE